MEGLSPEDKTNIVRGHKANLSNANTSEESKKNSQKVIDELGGDDAHYSKQDSDEKDQGNVMRGYKSTLSNPGVSDEAKQHAQEQLDKMSK